MRHADWQERLNAVIEDARGRAFEWGEHDCALFTCRCVDAVNVGVSFEQDVKDRLNYHSEEDIAPVIEAAGGMRAITSEFFGNPVARLLARPGDPVLIANGEREVLGIVSGHSAVVVIERGIAVIPLDRAVCGWRIG